MIIESYARARCLSVTPQQEIAYGAMFGFLFHYYLNEGNYVWSHMDKVWLKVYLYKWAYCQIMIPSEEGQVHFGLDIFLIYFKTKDYSFGVFPLY